MIFVKGFLGWGNRKNGVEAYGPDGRWGGRNQDGDLLGDALAREGDSEGSTLFVVSVSRSEVIADRAIEERVEAAIRDALRLDAPSRETTVADDWGQRVSGRCPACGSSALFVAVGGHITCGYIPCRRPTAVADFLLGEIDTLTRHAPEQENDR